MTADEFEEIAPILTSEQADVIIKEDILEGIEEEDGIDVSQLKKIAYHLDEDDLAALSLKVLNSGGKIGSILPFACYMGEDGLARVVNRAVELGCGLEEIVPAACYMAEDDVDSIALDAIKSMEDVNAIIPIACYMTESGIDAAALKLLGFGGTIASLSPIACYMSENGVAELIMSAMDSNRNRRDCAPYMLRKRRGRKRYRLKGHRQGRRDKRYSAYCLPHGFKGRGSNGNGGHEQRQQYRRPSSDPMLYG